MRIDNRKVLRAPTLRTKYLERCFLSLIKLNSEFLANDCAKWKFTVDKRLKERGKEHITEDNEMTSRMNFIYFHSFVFLLPVCFIYCITVLFFVHYYHLFLFSMHNYAYPIPACDGL